MWFLGEKRNTFVGKLSLLGDEWSPLRTLSACGQILQKNPGRVRPRQCLYFGNIWNCTPSLPTKATKSKAYKIGGWYIGILRYYRLEQTAVNQTNAALTPLIRQISQGALNSMQGTNLFWLISFAKLSNLNALTHLRGEIIKTVAVTPEPLCCGLSQWEILDATKRGEGQTT